MINMPSASARIYVYALGLTIAFCAGAWVEPPDTDNDYA